MNTTQIKDNLTKLFTDGDRIVFWYDPDKSFEQDVTELNIDGVSLWRLDENGPLKTKLAEAFLKSTAR